MEVALRARLQLDAGLAAIVGDRIDWLDRPAGSALPAICLSKISPGRAYTMDGPCGLHGSRVRFEIWGLEVADVKAAFQALEHAMEQEVEVTGVKFGMSFLDSDRDMPTEDVPGIGAVRRASADFIVWWNTI